MSPPVGDDGWQDVLGADEVVAGSVVAVDVGGRELAVWRTAAGVLSACDARCPHQWSHLAAAGVVDGDELVCLSHFWRFDTGGHGSKVTVRGRRDPKGDVPTFPVRQVDGRIEVSLPVPPSAP